VCVTAFTGTGPNSGISSADVALAYDAERAAEEIAARHGVVYLPAAVRTSKHHPRRYVTTLKSLREVGIVLREITRDADYEICERFARHCVFPGPILFSLTV
jgi:hypothetical protein